jgi:UDP-N-acetylmuramyl pentapeptide phosphotransferase/UDP-N-acetylglucosamine-1-phosphate transferase
MLPLPGWVLLHLVLAAGLTVLARRYAMDKRLLDQPGERRSHRVATPRGGGISIVVVTLLASILLALHWPEQSRALWCFAAGLVLVAAVGWLDDHRPLSPWLRLVVQGVAGAILGAGLYGPDQTLMTAAVALVLVMVLVNVWNFMDGIDGLATSQALIAAVGVGLFVGSGPWAWLAAGFAGAVAGFLPFNFPRARVFLGDVGSGAIGYTLAALVLVAYLQRPGSWMLLLLPICAFLVDGALTLARRIIRSEKWWTPHVKHAYQGWARRIGSHVPVTVAYGMFSLGAVLSMLWAIGLRPLEVFWVTAFWYGLAACTWVIQQRKMR